MKTIAVIEAKGTGKQVTNIFRDTVTKIYKRDINFVSFAEMYGYYPNSFMSLDNNYQNTDSELLQQIINKEILDITHFYKLMHKNNVNGMFRSAINAETLYSVRKSVKKVKTVVLPIRTKKVYKNLIFIRDQLQGYYSHSNVKKDETDINITLNFSQGNFNVISNFVRNFLDKSNIYTYKLIYMYKYHLFGFDLQKMIKKSIDGQVEIVQPDTGMHILLGELGLISEKNIVVVVGNEIGDMLLEALIHYYRLATKETFFTLNHAFIDTNHVLEILQTMHGSADNIENTQLLNPIATIKAAAYALENWLHVPNAVSKINFLIQEAIKQGVKTPDMGGSSKTDDLVNFVLDNFYHQR